MAQTQQPRKHRIKRFGWRPDLPDARDHLFAAPLETLATLPASADLRPQCPPVYDQGELGSCTANAVAGAVQFDRERQNFAPDFVPSRLFIYYNERVIEGTTGYDSGAQLRDGIKTVARQGVCPETEWPYVIADFTERPPEQAYADAALDLAVNYSRVTRTLTQLKACLAAGYPFVFGLSVYESFESEDSGAHGRGAHAGAAGEAARRPCDDGGGLSRRPAALHRAQLLGHGLGAAGLLHHALRLSDGPRARERFLDDPPGLGLLLITRRVAAGCTPPPPPGPARSCGAPRRRRRPRRRAGA